MVFLSFQLKLLTIMILTYITKLDIGQSKHTNTSQQLLRTVLLPNLLYNPRLFLKIDGNKIHSTGKAGSQAKDMEMYPQMGCE